MKMSDFKPKHFRWEMRENIAVITLSIPAKKNPLTFESYAELRDTFRDLVYAEDVNGVVITGAEGNFCSGGDVNDIIGPLTKMGMDGLLKFTRMTGDLVKAIRNCPQPVIAAIDGVCVGAGAMVATFSDIRFATPNTRTAFLFVKVGLSGCDMGACAMLPRIIGQGRAAELLFTGRTMSAEEGFQWGFFNKICPSEKVLEEAVAFMQEITKGPNFAHSMTKNMLNQEWSMSLDTAIEMEAQAQAICMQTEDFKRAYNAFLKKEKPVFEGD
ncbi:enoyl-CoA hydratase family protein [Candidatus Acetothermia bacterium]|nr:enoyl-CoA hydratase family protein [Candidatus Acetothermia bacterium]MBI3644148.1 enoyl-CoA hydratase family protein [Candidatus Acetothermia bacterium]